MDPTGERFLPTMDLQLALEHWHRYTVALPLVAGCNVLDIACGEGYGTHLLSSVAKSIVGIDLAEEAVEHARLRYSADTLRYEVGSVTEIPLPDASIDVVVSFETFEHVSKEDQIRCLDEVRRVLRPGGKLIVSTPDHRTYSELRNYRNEFHVHEVYAEDFKRILSERFKNVDMGLQKCGYFSVVTHEDKVRARSIVQDEAGAFSLGARDLAYEYMIAVCSDEPLEACFDVPSLMYDEQILTETHDRRLQYILGLGGVIAREREEVQKLTVEAEEGARARVALDACVAERDDLRQRYEAQSLELERVTADVMHITAELAQLRKLGPLDLAARLANDVTLPGRKKLGALRRRLRAVRERK